MKGVFVFLGDSLTRGYGVPEGQGWVELLGRDLAFKDIPMLNYGLDGDTLLGMKGRLEALDLSGAQRLCLMGGTNDILMGRSAQDCFKNLQSLLALGPVQDLSLVLAFLPPFDFDCFNQNPIVDDYNHLIRAYAEEQGIPVIDFYTPLKEASDFGLVVYEGDVHPNALGYKIMYQAAKEVLAR